MIYKKEGIYMLKALASDIDNTLFFRNQIPHIALEDIQAIKDFQQQGHLFGLCSGRPYQGVVHLSKDIHPDFYIITSGALILDHNLQIIYEKIIPKHTLAQLFHQYVNQALIIIQSANHKVYKTSKEFQDDECEIISSNDDIMQPAYGISLVFPDEKTAYQETKRINQIYHDVQEFQNVDSIDIVALGCSKDNALKIIKNKYAIDLLAGIGDSYNDLSMLMNVDIPITFTHAPKVLQDLAKYHVESVAEALIKL